VGAAHPDRRRLQHLPTHDIAQQFRKVEEAGEDLPVAITIGNEPVISIRGQR
jgi:UbiD family decarboxylase